MSKSIYIFYFIFFLLVGVGVNADELPVTTMSSVSSPVSFSNILQIAMSLLLVVILIFAAAWSLKRFGNFKQSASKNLKVLAGINLGQKEKIVLVQVGEEQIMIGVTPSAINALHVLEHPIEADNEADQVVSGFSGFLKQEIKNKVSV